MPKKRFRKFLIVTFIVIAVLVLAVILLVSPVAKNYIEKNDEKLTGRQIELDWVYINPFTGYAHIRNLRVFENGSNYIFFSAKGISVNVSLLKLFSKVYEISHFSLNEPKLRIIHNGDKFNFSDLVHRFFVQRCTGEKT